VPSKHITVEQVCVHNVVTVEHDLSITKCAKVMHDAQVGSLVITEVHNGLHFPLGILTDRDITIKVVAFALDPEVFTARDIMAKPLITARMHERLVAVVARMQLHGVRRVPVVSQESVLLGILEAEDLWVIVAEEMDCLEHAVLTSISKATPKDPRARKTALLRPAGSGKVVTQKKDWRMTPASTH
jgi:predicted transcriptional regulator